MRIDAHQHFWDPAVRTYPWLEGEWADVIRRRFEPADLAPHLRRHEMAGSILVQTLPSYDETLEFLETASGTDTVLGVVGWVDLTADSVADDIAGLLEAAGGGLLVGIRHNLHDEDDPEWLLRPDVMRGLMAVRDAGLAYDLLVRTRELPAAVRAASRVDDLRMVVDHVAKPPFGDLDRGQWRRWRVSLGDLAHFDHVSCKLSGLVSETGGVPWPATAFVPCVEQVLESFGEERVMFGSDWPVCLMDATYDEVVAIVEQSLGGETDATRRLVFGENAARFYGL